MPELVKDQQLKQEDSLLQADFYASLFAHFSDAILVLNPQLEVVALNAASEKATGIAIDRIIGKPLFEWFTKEQADRVRPMLERVLQGDKHLLKEAELKLPEANSTTWADIQLLPMQNLQGAISGLIIIATDITSRKQNEIALEQSEYAYRLLAESSSDSIDSVFRINPEGIIDFASPATAILTGYDPVSITGRPVTDFVHPSDTGKLLARHKEALTTGNRLSFSFRFQTMQGRYRWFESTINRITDPIKHNEVNLQAVLKDITAKKETEEKLQNKSKLLNGLLSNLPVMVKRIGADGKPVFMQGKALRKIGLDQNKWREAHTAEASPEVRAMVSRAMAGESVTLTENYQHQGRQVIFKSYYFPDLENPGGAIGFSIDITEQKQAEEKLVRNQEFIKKITDSTPFIITIFDFNRQEFVYSNRQVPEVLGYSLEEVQVLGPSLFMRIVHPDDLLRLADYIQEVASAADGEIKSVEIRVKDKNGIWRWFMSRSSIFRRTADGRAERALSVTQDIDEVRKSKDLLSGVLDSSPNAIMAMQALRHQQGEITDLEWILVNATTQQILGIDAGQLLGRRFLDVIPQTYAARLLHELKKVIETGNPLNSEIELEVNQEQRWHQINAVKMGDGCVVTLSDITEAKAAREKIRKNEALLQEAQKIAHLGIYELDLKSGGIQWSDELYRIFGLEPGITEVTIANFYSWLHPEDLQQVKDSIADCISNKETLDIRYRIITPDKEQKTIAAKGETICTPDGEPTRMIGTVLDISEIVNIRKELEDIQQIRFIGEAIPQIVWTSTPEGANDYMNRRWYEYTGITEFPDVKWDWSRVIHGDDLERTLRKWTSSLETGKELTVEFRIRNAHGDYRWHLIRMVPMRDENGQISKWFGTATDIEYQKQIQQELEEAKIVLSEYNLRLNQKNAQLQKINADLDTFIYTASHDLKAPIHNIEGLLDVLIAEIDTHTPTVSEVLEKMYLSINRFKATVLDLTEISKVERALEEDATVVNLPALLAEIQLDIYPLIQEANAVIEAEIGEAEVVFSRKNMRSVLYNLISNAIKYKSPHRKPVVKVKTYTGEDNTFVLEVADNGLGIDEKNLGKVFEMFRRIYTHVEGTGVGLYIVKRMIENAGGTIEVQSTFGQGSTFIIKVPQLQMHL